MISTHEKHLRDEIKTSIWRYGIKEKPKLDEAFAQCSYK